MKKIFFLFMLIPLLGMGQGKTVVNSFRVFAKPDKQAEFEKALAAHAQKYHTGNWRWRVYEIQSGPDAGGFHVVEGPLSWEDFDGRGNLGAEHTADWNKNVAPLTTGAGTMAYSQYHQDLSTVQVGDFTDKIIIDHHYPKPGKIDDVREQIEKLKKVWEAGNQTVAVYTPAASGEPQYILVHRLKSGLKEMDPSFRKPMSERFNAVHGSDEWEDFLEEYEESIERRWSELLVLRADLGSR